ncbi:MAG: flavodoxin domain-containing protein [Sphaerochaeta sp.]|nr:flavodoxin domain-containing protein [Sphaerochaeta sp.]
MAKTLIVFSSKRGTTKRSAQLLRDQLTDGADLHPLNEGTSVDLSRYDAVVIGGSVYVGKTNKKLRQFVGEHEAELLKKRVLALFLCGMEEGEGMIKQLEQNYSQRLRDKAVAVSCFGGEFLFSQMGPFTRTLMRLAVSREDVHQIDEAAIKEMAGKINSALA